MTDKELGEACDRLWQQQGVLFNKQRELIQYMTQFIPLQCIEDYNIRMNDINEVLNECKELDQKISKRG